jgi:hypothetical protein
MPSMENIVGNYINSERRFRSAVKKFAHSIIKEFNNNLNMNFRVKDIDVNVDGIINIIITIGNNEYNFFVCAYYMPIGNKFILECPQHIGLDKSAEIGLSSSPENIANIMIGYIDPRDIIKSKYNN